MVAGRAGLAVRVGFSIAFWLALRQTHKKADPQGCSERFKHYPRRAARSHGSLGRAVSGSRNPKPSAHHVDRKSERGVGGILICRYEVGQVF